MTLLELSSILKGMYENAHDREQVCMIHLFSIKYADEIINADFSKKDILKAAGMNESYHTEINKGVNLARYVVPKDALRKLIE